MSTERCDDPEIEYLVSGSIRDIQELLIHIIPQSVNYVCLKFYYTCERFIKCGSHLELRDDGRAVTYIKESFWDNTAHGMATINGNSTHQFSCCWKFKIIQSWGVSIGIVAAKEGEINVEQAVYDFGTEDEHYVLSDRGYQYDLQHRMGHKLIENAGFASGNFVTMIVEPSRGSVRYLVSSDDKHESIHALFKNIDFKDKSFKMAVSIGYPKSCLELIEFTKKYPSA